MKVKLICLITAAVLLCGSAASEDKTPSYQSFLVGNIYNSNMDTDPSGVQWFAEHYDFILNGLSRYDELKIYNPNLEAAYYTNLQMMGNRTDGNYTGWEYRAFMRFFDSAGIPAESAFVHFADSYIEQSLDGGIRSINIDDLKAHGNDSATRVSLRGWYDNSSDSGNSGSGYFPAGDGDWFCNITSPTYRKYRAAAEKFIYQNQDSILGFSNNVNYAYIDNFILDWGECTPGYWLDGSSRRITRSAGGPTGPDSWSTDKNNVDWDILPGVLPNDAGFLRQPLWDVLGEVQDSLESAGFGGCIPNVSSSSARALYSFVSTKHPAGVFFEYQGDNIVANDYNYGWKRNVQRHDTVLQADNGCMQFWEYRFARISDRNSPNADRLFLAAIGSFLCLQNPGTDFFKFGKLDSDYWFSAHSIDLGSPLGSRFDSTKVDLSGASGQKVILRKYENGLALFRPKMTSSSDTSASTGVMINLGQPVYRIGANYDSTFISDGRILIKAQEGILIINAQSTESYCETPPLPPMIQSPQPGALVDLNPQLCVYNVDHASCFEPFEYQFQIATDFGFMNIVYESGLSEEGAATTCITPAINFDLGRQYFWRTRAYNGTFYSFWSATGSFTPSTQVPSTPFVIQPADQSTVTTLQPIFRVGGITDADSDLIQAEVEVSSSSYFTTIIGQSGLLPVNNAEISWLIDVELTDQNSYFWRSRSFDGSNYSPWSITAGFIVSLPNSNEPPNQPLCVTPANGAIVSVQHPQLTASLTDDPNGDPLQYRFQISRSAAFAQVISNSPWLDPGVNSVSWTVDSSLISGEVYYWRARAHDGENYGPWGPTFSFTVSLFASNEAPPAPVCLAPDNNETILDTNPILIASLVVDPNGDQLRYRFALSTDVTFAEGTVYSAWIDPGVNSVSWSVDSGLTDGATYFWRAQAFDGESSSEWGVAYSFLVSLPIPNQPPPAPLCISPADNDTLLDVNPTLLAGCVNDPDGDSLQYRFQVASDNAFANVIALSDWLSANNASEVSWIVADKLPPNGSYFWRARAHDGTNYGPWGSTHSFYVATLATELDLVVDTVFIEDIVVVGIRLRGNKYFGRADITVHDQNRQAVSGAVVYGHFTGPVTQLEDGLTGIDGSAILYSIVVRKPAAEWGYQVDSLIVPGAIYDARLDRISFALAKPGALPDEFEIEQNYPNPFNPSTKINFHLAEGSKTILVVFNALGQTVTTLVDEYLNAGSYNVTWDGRDQSGRTASSGAYFYRIRVDDYSETKKMLLLK